MPNLDDDRLEAYMKQFRPLPAAPLPLNVPAATVRKPRHLGITVWALTMAAILILGVYLLRPRTHHVAESEITAILKGNSMAHGQAHTTQPLTLGIANELLVNSSSFDAALASLESGSGAAARIAKGKESALAVLSQEDPKP